MENLSFDAEEADDYAEESAGLFLFPDGGETLCLPHNVALLQAYLREIDDSSNMTRAVYQPCWRRQMLFTIAVSGCDYTDAQVDELWLTANAMTVAPRPN